jgi:hypothetical protein
VLKFHHHIMLCTNVGYVPFACCCIVLNDLLPIFREPILPLSMPFCFIFPPRITGLASEMGPMPNNMFTAFGDNLTPRKHGISRALWAGPPTSLHLLLHIASKLSLSVARTRHRHPSTGVGLFKNRGYIGIFFLPDPWESKASLFQPHTRKRGLQRFCSISSAASNAATDSTTVLTVVRSNS